MSTGGTGSSKKQPKSVPDDWDDDLEEDSEETNNAQDSRTVWEDA